MDWKSIGWWSGWKPPLSVGCKPIKTLHPGALKLLQNKILITVRSLTMVLQVQPDLFIVDAARTPCPITNAPKMTAVITLAQLRILLQQPAGTAPLQPLHQIRDAQSGRIADMQMNMIPAHHTF